MSELLTINEYSKVRGCSVSAVYKRLKSPSNRIHDFVVKEDGQTFLKEEILDFEGLRRPDPEREPTEPEKIDTKLNPSNTPTEPVEEIEEKPVEEGLGVMAIKLLEQQLLQKDKQIEDLNRRLDDAMKHAQETSDKLAALVVQANELQRNNQLLLAQTQQPKIEVASGEVEPEQMTEIQEKPKRSFWSKWFGK